MNLMRYEETFIGSFKNFMFYFSLFFSIVSFFSPLSSPVDMLFICLSEWVPRGSVLFFCCCCMSTGIQLSYHKKQVLYLQFVIGEKIRLLCICNCSDLKANWTFTVEMILAEGPFSFLL